MFLKLHNKEYFGRPCMVDTNNVVEYRALPSTVGKGTIIVTNASVMKPSWPEEGVGPSGYLYKFEVVETLAEIEAQYKKGK